MTATQLLAGAVPLAVLAVLLVSVMLRTRRGDFGDGSSGRRRAPWVLPVLVGAGAWCVLYLLVGR